MVTYSCCSINIVIFSETEKEQHLLFIFFFHIHTELRQSRQSLAAASDRLSTRLGYSQGPSGPYSGPSGPVAQLPAGASSRRQRTR